MLAAADAATMTPVLKLQAVPEETDDFLQNPADVCFSADGKVFVLDTTAKRVFVWDGDGRFLEVFGSEGNAPGEFVFSGRRGRGRGTGFIGSLGADLYVFDGAKQEINIFDAADHSFKKAIPYRMNRGRAMGFAALSADIFLVYRRSLREEGLMASAALYDAEKKQLATLAEAEITDFKITGERGSRKFHRVAFAPATVVHHNAVTGMIVVGHGDSPSFTLYDKNGKSEGKVTVKLPRLEVTKEDIAEYNSQEGVQNNRRLTVSFPDYKAYYDQILAVGRDGFLVFHLSPLNRLAEGWLIDRKGEIQGRFSYACGENGGLFGDRGRLLAVRTDEYGDYTMEELIVGQ
jgi:hypothetical protein